MTINRSIAPELHPISEPELTRPAQHFLDNKIPVYYLRAGKQDVCKIDFVFEAGVAQQDKPLISSITNAMLQEGTDRYTAAEIAEIFDFHGAYLQLSADYHYGTISLICLDKHLEKLLPVIEGLIKHSTLPESEFTSLIQRRKQRFLVDLEKVKILCQKKFSEVMFGPEHPYTLSLKPEDFDEVQYADFVHFYRAHYHSANCAVHVAGRFPDGLFDLLNKHFGGNDWTGTRIGKPIIPVSTSEQAFTRIEKADSIQSAIRMGKLLVNKDHPDFFGLQILTTILGGYFSSRLMQNIREEKGYTYGIGAHFVNLNLAGYLIIATEVDKTYEQATIDEIEKELSRLQNEPVGDDELARVRQYLTGEFLREFDGPFALSQAFRNIHDFGLNYDFYDRFFAAIQTITAAELQSLASRYLGHGTFLTVVAGQP